MDTNTDTPKKRGRPSSNKTPEERLASERERLRNYYAANKELISQRRRERYRAMKNMAAQSPVLTQ